VRQNGNAEIVVRDTGIGIPAEAQPRVFDRFYRVDKSRARTMGGAGLGLSIAQWIVEVHGGEINLVSSPGYGSTFTIVLPVASNKIASR
jgi:signal transduction histidine kinase